MLIGNHQKLDICITSFKSIHIFHLILSALKWSPHFNNRDTALEQSLTLSAKGSISACERKRVHRRGVFSLKTAKSSGFRCRRAAWRRGESLGVANHVPADDAPAVSSRVWYLSYSVTAGIVCAVLNTKLAHSSIVTQTRKRDWEAAKTQRGHSR